MTENILETIRKGVQDFVAPEVRRLKADFGGLGAKFDGLRAEFDALRSEVRANQQALMAALQNAVLRGEMETQPEISELVKESPVSKISFVLSGNNCLPSSHSKASK